MTLKVQKATHIPIGATIARNVLSKNERLIKALHLETNNEVCRIAHCNTISNGRKNEWKYIGTKSYNDLLAKALEGTCQKKCVGIKRGVLDDSNTSIRFNQFKLRSSPHRFTVKSEPHVEVGVDGKRVGVISLTTDDTATVPKRSKLSVPDAGKPYTPEPNSHVVHNAGILKQWEVDLLSNNKNSLINIDPVNEITPAPIYEFKQQMQNNKNEDLQCSNRSRMSAMDTGNESWVWIEPIEKTVVHNPPEALHHSKGSSKRGKDIRRPPTTENRSSGRDFTDMSRAYQPTPADVAASDTLTLEQSNITSKEAVQVGNPGGEISTMMNQSLLTVDADVLSLSNNPVKRSIDISKYKSKSTLKPID
nr:hypothetical protein [Babesia bovis]